MKSIKSAKCPSTLSATKFEQLQIEQMELSIIQTKLVIEEIQSKINVQKLVTTFDRIEHARRNVEAITRILGDSNLKEEAEEAIRHNIAVMNEIDKIK